MHIECILKRDGGSHIELDHITYHFAPQPDDAHVALVEHPAHQDRLLGIPEGYRLYRGEHKPASAVTIAELGLGEDDETAPADAGDEATGQVLAGSSQHDASYTIHGTTYALGDIVALAHAGSGMSVDEWNGLDDDTRADLIDAELDKLSTADPAADAPKKSSKKTK